MLRPKKLHFHGLIGLSSNVQFQLLKLWRFHESLHKQLNLAANVVLHNHLNFLNFS